MPQKTPYRLNRPDLNYQWQLCATCGVYLPGRIYDQHIELSCGEASSLSHYIKDQKYYGKVGKCTNEAVYKELPNVLHHQMIFIPYDVMKLCQLINGETLILTKSQDMKIPLVVWSVIDNTQVVYMTEKGFLVNDVGCEDKIELESYSDTPCIASSVVLELLDKTVHFDYKLATKLFVSQYSNSILTIGSRILIHFYGLDVLFAIKDIQTSLCNQMENMSIHKQSGFYLITRKTEVNVTEVKRQVLSVKEPLCLLGGLDNQINQIKSIMNIVFDERKRRLLKGLPTMTGILLHGPSGTGKTMLSRAIISDSGLPCVTIIASKLYSKFLGETESRLKSKFVEAKERQPSLIFIDSIDTLCPSRENTEQEQRLAGSLFSAFDSLIDSQVLVLSTTSRLDSIHQSLRRPGRLDTEIEIGVPTSKERFDILNKLLSQMEQNLTNEDIEIVAKSAHGFVGADLKALCTASAMKAIERDLNMVTINEFTCGLRDIRPSAVREVLIDVPNVHWHDIGGQSDLKLKLKQAVEWPLKHPEAFTEMGILPPKGILMYGPPGCSKTMIAKALATDSQLNFINVKASDLFNKWVGESEKAVQKVFRRARQVAPCIIFFDEIDSLGSERGGGSTSNVNDRVLTQLLTEIDGIEALNGVTIVAATNRPDMIDKALLRPGRLDRIVYVPLPDGPTRKEIFEINFRRMPIDPDVEIDLLVEKTSGYSGAEVSATCNEAALKALEEDIESRIIQQKHFVLALTSVTPRTPQDHDKFFKDFRNENALHSL